MAQQMNIDGPAGPLEARYDCAPTPSGAQAVLCHPHPQYGGSMDDAVLDTVARRLLAGGVGVLRFNFRGVGGSAGGYASGDGEQDDLRAAADWLRRQHAATSLWIGGYSFGAWIAWRARNSGVPADQLLLIAPPVGPMAFAPATEPFTARAIAGTADSFIDPAALQSLAGVTTAWLDDADHFFSGRHRELAAAVDRVLAPAG